MAWSSQGQWASSQNKVSGSSLTFTAGAIAVVNSVLVLVVAKDNIAATAGATNEVTAVSAISGNNWVKSGEFTNAGAATLGAGLGATCAIWTCVVTTQIATGASCTISFSQAVVAKTCTVWRFLTDSAISLTVTGTATSQDDLIDPIALTVSGQSSAEHLFVRGTALQISSFNMVPTDGNWSAFGTNCTAGGLSDDNMSVAAEWRIATATSMTSDITSQASVSASVLVSLTATATAPPPPPPPTATNVLYISPPTPAGTQNIQAQAGTVVNWTGDLHYAGRIRTALQLRSTGGVFYETASPLWHNNALQTYYAVNLFTTGWELNRFLTGNATKLASGTGSYPVGQWIDFDILQTAATIVVKLNGFIVADVVDPAPYSSGAVGMVVQDCQGELDAITAPLVDGFDGYAVQSLADHATIGNWNITFLNGGTAGIRSVSSGGTTITPVASIMDWYGDEYVWGAASGGGRVAVPFPATADTLLTQYTIRNEGVAGNSTTKALNGTDGIHPAWGQQLALSNAGTIGLMFGYAEAVAATPVLTMTNNLRQMIATAKNLGRSVILFSEHLTTVSTSSYNQAIIALATELALDYVDIYAWSVGYFTGALTTWCPDGHTPSQSTYDAMGTISAQQITPALPGISPIGPIGQSATDWVLTFNEEFQTTTLDATKWNNGLWFRRNPATLQNWAVSSCLLQLWPKQDAASATALGMPAAANNFYEREFATDGKFSQLYGYFEAEIQMPVGRGLLPAFWLFNHDTDPTLDTEIDIAEVYPGGYDNNVAAIGWASSQLHALDYICTVWNNTPGNLRAGYGRMAGSTGSTLPSKDLSATYNTYGVKWDATGVTPYFNGSPIGMLNEATGVVAQTLTSPSLNTVNFGSRPMYFVLSLWLGRAVGNESPWPNVTETPQGISNSMRITHVRAWRYQPGGGGGVGASVPAMANQYHSGMHAHRLYNGGGSVTPTFNWGVFRDWDVDLIADYQIWASNGTINFTTVDAVYAGHVARSAKIIKCFGSVPTWAAKVPTVSNVNDFTLKGSSRYGVPGSMSGPANLDVYEDFVFRFISHTRTSLFAVEGWNEPFNNDGSLPYEFFTGTQTELADIQQRVWRAAKRVDVNLPVFGPPQAYMAGIQNMILTAHCTDGSPITNYFDVLSWHPYTYSANGEGGMLRLSDAVTTIRAYLANVSANKPLADTEHGFFRTLHPGGTYFCDGTQATKAQVLYDLHQSAKALGLVCVCLYSYDDGLVEGGANFASGQPCALKEAQAYTDFDTKTFPTGVVATPPVTPPPTSGPGDMPFGRPASEFGVMTFRDEFDFATLNSAAWNNHIWYQTDNGVPNYDVANSCLRIFPTSAFAERNIDTDGKFEQKYGYWEAKCKLPIGKGCWPAFWLYYHNDSAPQPVRREIDIMEAYSGGGVASGWSDSNLHPINYGATLHEANFDYSVDNVVFARKLGDVMATVDLSAAFHYYAVKITAQGMQFYFDGLPLGAVWPNDGVFTVFQYIIFDLTFGSASGTPDGTTPLGVTNAFLIDWVRVWSLADGSSVVNTTLPPPVNGGTGGNARIANLGKSLSPLATVATGGANRSAALSLQLAPIFLQSGSTLPITRFANVNKVLDGMQCASSTVGAGGGTGGTTGGDDDSFLTMT